MQRTGKGPHYGDRKRPPVLYAFRHGTVAMPLPSVILIESPSTIVTALTLKDIEAVEVVLAYNKDEDQTGIKLFENLQMGLVQKSVMMYSSASLGGTSPFKVSSFSLTCPPRWS